MGRLAVRISTMNRNTYNSKIRALVVDGSPFMGMQIAEILNADEEIEVVGRARTAIEALEMVELLRPDVLTMDVAMQDMEGIAALKHIMAKYPVPTVVISSYTQEATEIMFDVLRYGAVDVIAKPSASETASLEAQRSDIVARVKLAASLKEKCRRPRRGSNWGGQLVRGGEEAPDRAPRYVCLGALTAGYYALIRIIPWLGPQFQDVLFAMIPASACYVDQFTRYLAAHSSVFVQSLGTAGLLRKGTCYVCSSQDALVLSRDGKDGVKVEIDHHAPYREPEETINRVFTDLASIVGPQAVAIALTSKSCGRLDGLKEVQRAGGTGVIKKIADGIDASQILALLKDGRADGDDDPWGGTNRPSEGSDGARLAGGESGTERDDLSGTMAFFRESFRGDLAKTDILDHLQFVLLTGKATVLEVFSSGGLTGRIYVSNGRVLHAQCGDLQGDQALHLCLTFRGGSFTNRKWSEPTRISMNKSGELVLLEAIRRRQEAHWQSFEAAR